MCGHGHNYSVDVIVSSLVLNSDGMVIDFGKLKDIIKPIIDEYDHSFMLSSELPDSVYEKNTIFLNCNPTSENIARLLFIHTQNALFEMDKTDREDTPDGQSRQVYLEKVRVYETDTSWSEYSA